MSLYTVYCDNVLDMVDQIALTYKDYVYEKLKRKKQIEKCVYYYYNIA